MQFFIDSADVNEIRQVARLGFVEGVTTNPTLIAKTGRDLEETIKEICKLVRGPVNAETLSTKADEMVSEGRKMAKWAKNVVIKIPMCRDGLEAAHRLSQDGVRTTMTLVFSANQALLAAAAGASFVCPFVGRLDDISGAGMDVLAEMAEVFENYELDCRIIAASIRHPMHVLDAARAGVDIVTVPAKVLEQMIEHPLTTAGIERFLVDAAQATEATGGAKRVARSPRR